MGTASSLSLPQNLWRQNGGYFHQELFYFSTHSAIGGGVMLAGTVVGLPMAMIGDSAEIDVGANRALHSRRRVAARGVVLRGAF